MLLQDIKGIGAKRTEKLNEVGIFTPNDLILHFPYKYLDFTQKIDINSIGDGEEFCFIGKVNSECKTMYIRKGLMYVKTSFAYGDLTINCTFFNQKFIANRLKMGAKFCVSGKIKRFKSRIELSAPSISAYDDESKLVVPLYRPIKGLPSSTFLGAIKQVMQNVTVHSYVDEELRGKYGLIELNKAMHSIHFPHSFESANKASESVEIEKLANEICTYSVLKNYNKVERKHKYDINQIGKVKSLISSLKYELTNDQQIAVDTIINQLSTNRENINILLEGDVGSGKTIVAFILLYFAVLSGYQGAIMSPTEILAVQHYKNAIKLFENLNVNIAFLASSQSKHERELNLFNIKNGVADIVIGTHSLLQKSVEFCNLSLVITDEQHRFGVSQRASFENKSASADTIVMSATPIPRTLALTLYGDLQLINIVDKPPLKASISTRRVPNYKVDDMYNYLLNKCKAGEQAFIICPRIIDEDENLPSVSQVYSALKDKFTDYGIAQLHGKIKEKEKNQIMEKFASGEIKILVSTTVVEVGIDIKNATSIVILNADRYGLSQLHQLRGRVGRGELDSFCFILSDSDSVETLNRLDFFSKCDNGFELAEYDFKERGAGDMLGVRQSGASSIKITPNLILKAKSLSEELAKIEQNCLRIINNSSINQHEFIKNITLN